MLDLIQLDVAWAQHVHFSIQYYKDTMYVSCMMCPMFIIQLGNASINSLIEFVQ